MNELGIGVFRFGKILDEKFQHGFGPIHGGRGNVFNILRRVELIGALQISFFAFFDAHFFRENS